jgi:hypothetical protein
MKRTILIVIGGVAVVFFFVFSSLDPLIKEAVETYGSQIIQAEVKLDGVELDPGSGKGALKGLMVGNPRGFETPSAFKLGMVSLHVDIGTLTGDTVVIKEIIIDKPEVTYELGSGGSNIDAIRKNVEAYMGGGAGGAGKKKDTWEGPKLIIKHFYVRGGTVNVSATILAGKTLDSLKQVLGGTAEGAGAAISKAAEGVSGAVGESAGEIGKKLKGIFGN